MDNQHGVHELYGLCFLRRAPRARKPVGRLSINAECVLVSCEKGVHRIGNAMSRLALIIKFI